MTDQEPIPSLDAVIAARAQALAAKVKRSGGRLDPEDAAETLALSQLQQFVALQRPPRAPARWPAAITLVTTLAFVSALMGLHVNSTPVELDAEVTAVSFQLADGQPQPLTGTLALTALRAVGVHGPDGMVAGQPVVLAAKPTPGAGCQPSLTLDPLILPARARMTVAASSEPTRLRLSLLAPGANLQLSQTRCPGSGATRDSRSLVLKLGTEEADLELVAAAAPVLLAPTIAIQKVALDEVETFAGDAATHVRRTSTVRSAQVHRLALEGEPLTIRRGELITLGGERNLQGQLRELETGAGILKLRFAGTVDALTKGDPGHARNLMPTCLEWLRANQVLALVWGSALSVFGLAIAVGRWWRGK